MQYQHDTSAKALAEDLETIAGLDDPLSRASSAARHAAQKIAWNRVARAFGARYGLNLSPEPFKVEQLSRGMCLRSKKTLTDFGHPHADHPFFFRYGKRSWMVAAHLYDRDMAACEAWAASHGLQAQAVDDFPSWWLPGRTSMVIYFRPAEPPRLA